MSQEGVTFGGEFHSEVGPAARHWYEVPISETATDVRYFQMALLISLAPTAAAFVGKLFQLPRPRIAEEMADAFLEPIELKVNTPNIYTLWWASRTFNLIVVLMIIASLVVQLVVPVWLLRFELEKIFQPGSSGPCPCSDNVVTKICGVALMWYTFQETLRSVRRGTAAITLTVFNATLHQQRKALSLSAMALTPAESEAILPESCLWDMFHYFTAFAHFWSSFNVLAAQLVLFAYHMNDDVEALVTNSVLCIFLLSADSFFSATSCGGVHSPDYVETRTIASRNLQRLRQEFATANERDRLIRYFSVASFGERMQIYSTVFMCRLALFAWFSVGIYTLSLTAFCI